LVEEFRRAGHLPCPGSISLWGRPEAGFNDFILNPMGPGWHLDRRRFEQMLAARAEALGAEVVRQTQFVTAEFDGAVHEASLRNEDDELRVQARWVIDATGAQARFGQQHGARQIVHDRYTAIARFWKLSAGEFSGQTLLEAVRNGWWYAARLPGNRVLTMLVAEPDDVKRLAAANHAVWHEELRATQLLAPRLTACELIEGRFLCLPVLSCLLDPVQGDQWLAIGDAASCYDPISSQGIYKALVDAGDAATHVVAALGHREPPPWNYAGRVRSRFQDYLANRAYLYAQEQRWPGSPFWYRRAAAEPLWP
jgi:flavin-dependent dehydrogenase